YDWLAGSSPTSTTARPGVRPRAANSRVSAATLPITSSAIALPSSTKALVMAKPLKLRKSASPIGEARLAPGAPARREHVHRRFVEQVAGKAVRVAVARPGFETDERRAGARPQRGVLEVGKLHRDRRARGVVEGERAAHAIEEAHGVVGEEGVVERQVAPVQRDRLRRLADQAPGSDRRNLAAFRLLEAHERPVAALLPERPAEARMQAAGVGRGLAARIGDLQRHAERVLRQAVLDGECEGEGVDGACALVVAEDEPHEVRLCGLDREGLEPGEAVQAERVLASADPGAVARPADHRIENRADVGPDRRIARPKEVSATDPPASRLGAQQGVRRAGGPATKLDSAHRVIPSIAAAEISASLTP